MEQQLLEVLNQHGIVVYTAMVAIASITLYFIYDLLFNLSACLYECARYYYKKRKLLKKS